MFKITFGKPENNTPSKFCDRFCYKESKTAYDCDAINFYETTRGCSVEIPLKYDEQVFGFGLQLNGFNHKNRKLSLRVNSDPIAYTGDSHAPVPFFVTNKGYGMYFDTARFIDVYCGFYKKKRRKREGNLPNNVIDNFEDLYINKDETEESMMTVDIPGAKGIEIYIFEGNNITDIVSKYNMLSGGGCNIPEWGLGTAYRAYANYTDKDIIKLSEYFRKNDLKIDIIGLEPGWQTKSYSCSYVWDKDRFPNYRQMIKTLKSNGFHINLWEHAFVDCSSPIYKDIFEFSGNYEVFGGLVPDFASKEACDIFADYHMNEIVSLGIDGFKLDECDSSDFVTSDWSFPNCAKFPSGLDGEQYHSLFGTLYMKTILRALGDNETISYVRNAGALAASYPFVLYSDLYGHKDFIRGIVNAGFSGLLWSPEVRDAKNKKDFIRRLQTSVFSAQNLINAWYLDKAPWSEFDCESEVKELLDVRKKLVPMLKSAFEKYQKSGKPPIRALVSDYTDDKETYKIDDEYIFCDKLIVAPLTEESDFRSVYLPEGIWRDYWTKERVFGGWFEVETQRIPVYEKIGQI